MTMAPVEDLIDFNVIEGQKENIAALPSGRSAKTLAQRFSPLSVASPGNTEDINASARAEFEEELLNIDESDDPLDIYDRYVRWTLNAYPSVATGQSQLLPLLERATKAFLKDENYKNDPRYLKLWLNYIRLFSDAPRETFAYLARHDIGTGLALYYEEFAAWLENAARFTQAEEIYKLGIERQARPAERLLRKFGGFEQRAQAKLQDTQQPSSPALPLIRPALGAKIDPFSTSSPPVDPQAADRARAAAPTTSKRQKMQIFSDNGVSETPSSGDRTGGLEDLATVAERRRENVVLAQPWDGGKKGIGMKLNSQVPKMAIFKDTVSHICSTALTITPYLRSQD